MTTASVSVEEPASLESFVPEPFVGQVEECLDQAVAEGWLSEKNTATTVYVAVGCLLVNIEALANPEVVRAVRRWITTAMGVA